MEPDLIFNIGIVAGLIVVFAAVIAIVILRLFKIRLNKQLDAEYGKRGHWR